MDDKIIVTNLYNNLTLHNINTKKKIKINFFFLKYYYGNLV